MALSLADAIDRGLTRHSLRGKRWKRIGSKIYQRADAPENRIAVLAAWQRSLPQEAVFCGTSAAFLHGLDFDPTSPVHVAVPPASGTRSRAGVHAHRTSIRSDEVVTLRGLRATTLNRTLMDLCIQLEPVEALVAIDMALRRRKITRTELTSYAAESAGRAGSARLRELTALAESVDSPMETRLRWLLLDDGLPRPEVQKDLRDGEGHLIGRADLFYRAARLVIEFDGMNHKERLVADDRRQNKIVNAGYRLLRFTSADLRDHPEVIVAQVRAALASPRPRV
ncbi:MAG TPA: DUF559 domain-containing protein [Candidatus Dormibacteraeota bacterium]|nr:DUF559 domain-containing protein [Candidatus Dormibacteraeota bacterium]